MEVTFSDTVIVKSFEISKSEKRVKKSFLQMIKNNTYDLNLINITRILYKEIPTESEYVNNKMKGKTSINWIRGIQRGLMCSTNTLYDDKNNKIEYIIKFGIGRIKVEICTNMKNKDNSNTYYVKWFPIPFPYVKKLITAEYKAKKYIIEISRIILNQKNIT